jgi:Domain of unknown function (DUF4330)
MAIVDERGRVFGRINLIDAGAALLLFVMIPVAYGAYLLFRMPPARITSIDPAKVYHGPNQRVQIRGINLRPYMRVAFGGTQGITFAIFSTNLAQAELPELAPGVYDVALYDYKQEVDRLPKALEVLTTAPIPTIVMDVSGSFKNQTAATAMTFKAGQKLVTGDSSAEVLRLGTPVPSAIRLTAGTTTFSLPVPGQMELPAALRIHCFTEVGPDATVRCMFPGPEHPAVVAPDSVLLIPAGNGWAEFQIRSIALTLTPQVVTLRTSFVTSPEIAAQVKPGDVDADAVAYPNAMRATITTVTARSVNGSTVLDATLNVPASFGPTGWSYNNQPLKAGLPIRFETIGYSIQGQVTAVKAPAAAPVP